MKFDIGDHAFYIQSSEYFTIIPVVIIDTINSKEYMVEERGTGESDAFTVVEKELFNHPRAIQKAREYVEKN